MEHTSRAMIDGQIHEISKVVEVVSNVKEKLENRLGFELTKVAIAAAGRSLKTNSAMVDRKLQTNTVINQEMIIA
jgi:cell division ATPase FtsA